MKNKIKVVLLTALCIYFISCNSQKHTAWQQDVKINKLDFKKIRYNTGKDGKDTLEVECVLKNNSVIDGFPCSTENVTLSKDWKLKSFVLGDDFVMSGNTIPKGTFIRVYKDRLLCMFPEDVTIQSYRCRGDYDKMGTEGYQASLYTSGRLRYFYPVDDVMIDNVFCKSSPFAGVRLYENGKLKKCKLSKDQTISGVKYKRNTNLNFDENGNVVKE